MSTDPFLYINGKMCSFQQGETILEVAARNRIFIPTLCYLKGAFPTGACRMCVVEVEGARNLVASCAAPAGNNMVVYTESEKVIESRKMTLRLLLSSGHHQCLLCPAAGECILQDLAYRYQVSGEEFLERKTCHDMEAVNPFILRDFSRCILCGRCVQACQDIQVNNAISHGYRGINSKIVAAGDRPLKDSDCVFCGECIQVCPTGALLPKDARFRPRTWETKKIKTTCAYCGVGCQMYLHVKDNKVHRITGVEDVLPNYGSLCVKGRFGFEFINSYDRLTQPLIKENGKFKDVSWDVALERVSQNLQKIKNDSGADSLGVLASARITNEENYLVQKFTRAVLGTNNIDHCARLCHSSTVTGLAAVFGSGAMTNSIADIEKADVILVTGSNTTENHPVLASYIKRAVKHKQAKLIVVDPRRIELTKFAQIWLRPQLGSDVAWINGLMQVIIKEGLYDSEFVQNRTTNFEDLKKTVERYTPEYVQDITGIPAKMLQEAARLYAKADSGSIFYTMGITQHTSGTDNVKSLANLAMLCGNLGIEGGGVNPLRGQNNVQGACDLGGLPNVYSGYQKVTDPQIREKMAKAWQVDNLPQEVGLQLTEMLPKAKEGKIKSLYIIGENPVLSDPDSNHVKMALQSLEFLVVQDIFMTETAKMADVVLPSACFAEKDGTFTNTERRVQRVRQAVNPPGQAKTDLEIVMALSEKMGCPMPYTGAKEVMQEIAQVTPSYSGITYERIEDQGIQWPCPDTEHPGTPILHCQQFSCGLGQFQAIEYVPPAEMPDEEYPLCLTTGRIRYHYHTNTMTGKVEGLNTLAPENFIEISPQDAAKLELENESLAQVISRRGSIQAKVKISPVAVPGTVFIPFHYAKSAANALTNSALDPIAGIPEFKVCSVKLSKVK